MQSPRSDAKAVLVRLRQGRVSKPRVPTSAPARKGKAPTDDVAERILDAARDHFIAFGLRHASMEDVAKRAKLSRITLYRRFASKAELVQAVTLREIRVALAEVERGLERFSLDEGLVEGFVRTLTLTRSHPLVSRLLENEADVVLPLATLEASPFLSLGVLFLSQRLRRATRSLSRAPSPKAGLSREDALSLSEILVRVTLSFVLTPQGAIDLSNEKKMRQFAERYVVRLVRAFIDAR